MKVKVSETGVAMYYVTDELVEDKNGIFIPFHKALENKEMGRVIINTSNTPNAPIIKLNADNINPKLKYEVHGTSAVAVNVKMNIEGYDNSYICTYTDCNVTAYDNAFVKDFAKATITLHNNAKSMCIDTSPIDETIAHEAENAVYDIVQALAKDNRSLNIGDTVAGVPENISEGYDRSQIYTCFYNDLRNNNGINVQLAFDLMECNIERYADVISYHRIHDISKDIADFRSIKIHDEYKENILQNIPVCNNIIPDGDSIVYNSEDRTISILRYDIKADMREFSFTDIPFRKGAITCRTITTKDIEKACSQNKNFEDVATYLSISGKSKSSCPYSKDFATFAELYNPPANSLVPHMKIKDYNEQAKDFIKFIDDNIKFPIPLCKTIQDEMKRVYSTNSKYFNALEEKEKLYLLTAENFNSDMPIEYHLFKYITVNNDYNYLAEYRFSEQDINSILEVDSVDEASLCNFIIEAFISDKTYTYEEDFGKVADYFLTTCANTSNIRYCYAELGNDKILKFIEETNQISLVLPFRSED